MYIFFCFLLLCSMAKHPAQAVKSHIETDVCIYGATPGGIAAAIAAAKNEKHVLLIEPTRRIGGMLTSGLSHSDFHSFEGLSGTFLDFTRRVETHYVKEYGEDSEQVRVAFRGTFGEPKVNLLVLESMIAEYANITVLYKTVLDSLSRSDDRIDRVFFHAPGFEIIVDGKVFIDGSYEGDLMAMAGEEYRVGREARTVYGESLAPSEADRQLQGYNFRFCATTDPENRAQVLAPKGYRREDFLDLLPILESGAVQQVFGYPSACIFKAQEPPLPNNKYDINDVSRGLVRLSMPGYNREWPEGTPADRRKIFDEHLRYNVGLLYFLQNDTAVPEYFQQQAKEWGWCKDEFIYNNHLPPQLYVREARRMVGQYVYKQADSEHAPGDARAVLHKNAVAMGEYGNNCHGTDHEGPLIGGKHSGEFYNPVPPYQIPYGVIVPVKNRNLLVPVAVSASHVGFCALRLEYIWMALGQAAGHAASMAVDTEVSVRDIDVKRLQRQLHGDGSAPIYISDVLPGYPDFASAQWWGTQGGFHGLHPLYKPGQRGPNIHGQYYEAYPYHEAALQADLDGDLRQTWIDLARSLGIQANFDDDIKTRKDFVKAAFSAYYGE